MKMFRSVLPLLAMTLPLTAADFASGIRAVLPSAEKAEPASASAPAAAVAEVAPAAEAKTAIAKVELSYTDDAAPAADVSPAAHAEAYQRFCSMLKEQAAQNLYDFCPAMEQVLKATNDPFAVASWMEQASKEGYAAAQQFMADRRLVNVRMDELQAADVKAAYALARKAADAGYDPAKVNVYMCLRSGVGVAKDEKAAEKYILNACKDGGYIPRFKWLQIGGRLTTYDDRERKEVKAELERGNHHVAYFIATLAPTTADKVDWFRKAAEMGNGEALYALSVMVSERDPKAGFELLKEAIKLHSAEAMFDLAAALTEADPNALVMKQAGIAHDDVSGRHLAKIAGMLGCAKACFWLGHVYHDGVYGVKKDDMVAFRWFEKGALAGSLACGTSQGIMLLTGVGTEQQVKLGLAHLNAAANAGSAHAVVGLAYALYNGLGTDKDARKAAEILQEAAAMGNPEAYIYLAYITAKGGADLPADAKRAERYVRLASLDMKDAAKQMYEKLMAEGWILEP